MPLAWGGCGYFSENLADVVQGSKYGFMDLEGDLVIPAQYQICFEFSHGFAPVAVDSEATRWRFIDPRGTAPFGMDFEGARPFPKAWLR